MAPKKKGGSGKKKKEVKKKKDSREETIEKRQEAQKEKFVETLKRQPVIEPAAAITGVHRSTYYRWVKEDSQFRNECREAQEKGVEFVNDMMESLLIKKAKEGNMTSIIFWLKNNSAKYGDKRFYNHEHHIREEEVLTKERQKEIALAMMRWDEMEEEEIDDLFEDYEIPNQFEEDNIEEQEGKEVKKIKKAKTKKTSQNEMEKSSSPSPKQKKGVAKKIKPKRKKDQ